MSTNPAGHSFKIGRLEGGRFAACSKDQAPYFFFVGNTRDEVIAIANRALSFYYDCEGFIVDEERRPERQITATSRSKFRALETIARQHANFS